MVQLLVPRSLILQERDPIEEFAVGVAMVALTSLVISCPVPTLTSRAHLYDFLVCMASFGPRVTPQIPSFRFQK